MKLTKSLLKEFVIKQLDEGIKKSAIANKYTRAILESIVNKKNDFVIGIDPEDQEEIAYKDIRVTKSPYKPQLGQTFSAKGNVQRRGDGWTLNLEITCRDDFSRKDFESAFRPLSELLTHEYVHGGSIVASDRGIESLEDYYAHAKTIYGAGYPDISKELENLIGGLDSYSDAEAIRGYAKSGEIEAFTVGWMKTFKSQRRLYDNDFSNMIFFKLRQLKDKLQDPSHPNVQKIMDLLFKEYESYYKSRYHK